MPIIPMPRRFAASAGESPAAVVANGEVNLALVRLQLHLDALGARVARDVGERLLRDAEEVGFGLVGQAAGEVRLEITSIPVRAVKPSASQRRPASRPKSSRMVGRSSCDIWRTLPMASSTRRRQSSRRARFTCPPASSAARLVFIGGERLAQFVVQLVREAPRGGLLILQHVERYAAQFARLPFHAAHQLRAPCVTVITANTSASSTLAAANVTVRAPAAAWSAGRSAPGRRSPCGIRLRSAAPPRR